MTKSASFHAIAIDVTSTLPCTSALVAQLAGT